MIKVTAYKGVEKAGGKEVFDSEGNLKGAFVEIKHDKLNDNLGKGLQGHAYYRYTSSENISLSAKEFQDFQNVLAKLTGHPLAERTLGIRAAKARRNPQRTPFSSLIETSNRGALDSCEIRRLTEDFNKNKGKAFSHESGKFQVLYYKFAELFENAGENAAVTFTVETINTEC